MPEYRFRYQYTALGERVETFENDDEARSFGWVHPEDLIDPFYDYDVEIDADDVDITRLKDDEDGYGTPDYDLYEED